MDAPAFNETEYLRARVAELERLVGASPDEVDQIKLQRAFGVTWKQAQLLIRMHGSGTRLVTHRELLCRLYPDARSRPESKIISVFVCLIRGKLRELEEPEFFETVWGQGYRLTEDGVARISETIGEGA